MSNLELTQFGVQELNAKEMVELEGGLIWLLPAVAAFVVGVYVGYKEAEASAK